MFFLQLVEHLGEDLSETHVEKTACSDAQKFFLIYLTSHDACIWKNVSDDRATLFILPKYPPMSAPRLVMNCVVRILLKE